MIINITIDTDNVEDIGVSIPYLDARKRPVLDLIRTIIVRDLQHILPKFVKKLEEIEVNGEKNSDAGRPVE